MWRILGGHMTTMKLAFGVMTACLLAGGADARAAAERASVSRFGPDEDGVSGFGELFRITTFGESHGAAYGGVVDAQAVGKHARERASV